MPTTTTRFSNGPVRLGGRGTRGRCGATRTRSERPAHAAADPARDRRATGAPMRGLRERVRDPALSFLRGCLPFNVPERDSAVLLGAPWPRPPVTRDGLLAL